MPLKIRTTGLIDQFGVHLKVINNLLHFNVTDIAKLCPKVNLNYLLFNFFLYAYKLLIF